MYFEQPLLPRTDIITLIDHHQGDVWSLGCALYKWTTGKEFAYLAAGARLQDTLHLVPPSWGDKASPAVYQPSPTLFVPMRVHVPLETSKANLNVGSSNFVRKFR